MSISLIVILIVLGLALIVVEIVVLPGITVAGIGGLILIAGSVFLAFINYGDAVGIYVLIGIALLFILFMAYALRAKSWKKLSLHSEIKGKVNVLDTSMIKIGDKAMTLSRLAPIGKIMVNGIVAEGKSAFGLIDENTEVEVIQVDSTTIVVQKINHSQI